MEAHTYQIRVRGHLDARRLSRWADLTITHTPDGETIITGAAMDQAALHAMLNCIRDLGLELIALQREGGR